MAFRAYFDEMILTKSQTNLEFGSFSSKPRSLRVTHKSDRGQKSTYFLQIPLPLAIFYYTVVTLYNWMVASVLFSKVLNITCLGDPNTMLDPIYAIGSPEVITSATGFVAAMSILLPYIVVFVVPFVMQIKLHQRTLALSPPAMRICHTPGATLWLSLQPATLDQMRATFLISVSNGVWLSRQGGLAKMRLVVADFVFVGCM